MGNVTDSLQLGTDINQLIEQSRQNVAVAVNAELTLLYWNIGTRIKEDILKNNRAEYGKQIIESLSLQLTEEYGAGWSEKQLRHCLRFAEIFPDLQIVSTLWRQLSWSHLKLIFYMAQIQITEIHRGSPEKKVGRPVGIHPVAYSQ